MDDFVLISATFVSHGRCLTVKVLSHRDTFSAIKMRRYLIRFQFVESGGMKIVCSKTGNIQTSSASLDTKCPKCGQIQIYDNLKVFEFQTVQISDIFYDLIT